MKALLVEASPRSGGTLEGWGAKHGVPTWLLSDHIRRAGLGVVKQGSHVVASLNNSHELQLKWLGSITVMNGRLPVV